MVSNVIASMCMYEKMGENKQKKVLSCKTFFEKCRESCFLFKTCVLNEIKWNFATH